MKRIVLATLSVLLLSVVMSVWPRMCEVRAWASVGSPVLPTQGLATITINDVSRLEGNAGASLMIFTVTLTTSAPRPTIGINYTTADGAPPAGATQPSDYTATSGQLIFPAGGSASMTISVPIHGDTAAEPDETFFVNLSLIDGGATIIDGQGVGTILTDEQEGSTCEISLMPQSLTVPATGGTYSLQVNAAGSCNWEASVELDYTGGSLLFVSILSGGAGSGNGTIRFSVQPNVGVTERVNNIRVRNRLDPSIVGAVVFRITQEASDGANCTYSFSPTSATVEREGTTNGSFTVATQNGCPLTATSNASWIHAWIFVIPLDPTTAQVGFIVDRNPGGFRAASISVGNEQFPVYQNGRDCPAVFVGRAVSDDNLKMADQETQLSDARNFRDEVLAKTERGQKYTRLYYQFSSEVVTLMMLNPSLILRSQEIMTRYMPVIRSMVKGEPVTLSEGDLEEIDDFLQAFAQKGSAELRETLKGLGADLRDPQVHGEFNITLTAGQKRELPKQLSFSLIKQAGLMLVPLGMFFFFVRTPIRCRLTGRALKRWLCVGFGFAVLASQSVVAGTETRIAHMHHASATAASRKAMPASVTLIQNIAGNRQLGGSGALFRPLVELRNFCPGAERDDLRAQIEYKFLPHSRKQARPTVFGEVVGEQHHTLPA